jgi:hypothetical protein
MLSDLACPAPGFLVNHGEGCFRCQAILDVAIPVGSRYCQKHELLMGWLQNIRFVEQ